MDTRTDTQLLSEFARSGAHEPFALLVARRIDLVHSAAVRQVRDPHLAQDITQAVFVLLARKARSLAGSGAPVSPWLLSATRWVALDALRKLARQRKHERKAAAMTPEAREDDPSPREAFDRLAPHLDAALSRLGERDRAAIVLRYFEDKSLREVATELGVTEAAAKQRVFRAVEKLRQTVGARDLSTGALAAAITAHAIAPAPAGLAHAAAASAVSATAPTVASLAKGALYAMAWNKLKLTVVAAALLLTATPVAVVTYHWLTKPPAPAHAKPIVLAAATSQPAPLPATVPAPARSDWRTRFDALYRLDDGQSLKRIPLPFIPERQRYIDQLKLGGMFDITGGISVFEFDGDRAHWNRWTAQHPATIESLLRFCANVPKYKLVMDEFDRMTPLEGDWVIRKGAGEDEVVAALARELSVALPHAITFAKRTVDRDVFVAHGRYHPTVKPDALGQPPSITLYLDKPHKPDNHAAGNVHDLLVTLGEAMNTEVVDETDDPRQQGVFWTNQVGGGVAGDFRAKLLQNVTTQTGITFIPARRPREVWEAVIDK